MRRWPLLFVLFLPLASAQWLVSVDSNPFSADLFVVATSPGCIYVIDGRVLEVYELNNGSFVQRPPSREICVDAEAILRLRLSGNAYLSFPPSDFVVRSTFLSSVHWDTYTGHSILSVTPVLWPLVPLLFILVAFSSLIYVRFRLQRKPGDLASQIVAFIAQHPGCTQKDICNALGLEKYQVSRILSRLETEGKVIRVRRGVSKRVYLPDQLQ